MKLPPKIEKAMSALCVGTKGPVKIHEVVGPDGLKVGEYKDDGKEKKPPYYILQERHQL